VCAGINRHEGEDERAYEKGLANCSAPSFAPRTVRGEAKRKQGIGGLGIVLRKDAIRMLTPYTVAESHMDGNDNASPGQSCVVEDPRARLETHAREPGDLGDICDRS
jgi:hypothetical protein